MFSPLKFMDGSCVPEANREVGDPSTRHFLIRVRVHGEAFACRRHHHNAPAAGIVGHHRSRHPVHEMVLLVQVLREDEAQALLQVDLLRLEEVLLQKVPLVVKVVLVGLDVAGHRVEHALALELEEHLAGEVVHECSTTPRTGDDGCLSIRLREEVLDILRCWLVVARTRLVPPADLLHESAALFSHGSRRSQGRQLLHDHIVLAPPTEVRPMRAVPQGFRVDAGKLPRVAE